MSRTRAGKWTCAAAVLALILAGAGPSYSAGETAGGDSKIVVLGGGGTYSASFSKIAEVVKERIGVSADVYKIKVRVVPGTYGKPEYLLAWVLSAKDYSMKEVRIKVDENYKALSPAEDYDGPAPGGDQKRSGGGCPDPQVNFVAGTPVPDIPTAAAAVQEASRAAGAKGYKTAVLSGEQATTQAYLNYLACPNLKGFYNVGHGLPSGIMLADGELSADQFTGLNLRKSSVVVFNSCQVFNDPLKGKVIGAQAQKYGGGITNLSIGPSEAASTCFWKAGFEGKALTASMTECAQKHDPNDTWGFEGPGEDKMGQAQRPTALSLKPLSDLRTAALARWE
jgi:hypothetical protein